MADSANLEWSVELIPAEFRKSFPIESCVGIKRRVWKVGDLACWRNGKLRHGYVGGFSSEPYQNKVLGRAVLLIYPWIEGLAFDFSCSMFLLEPTKTTADERSEVVKKWPLTIDEMKVAHKMAVY